jgi:hypothetical protein
MKRMLMALPIVLLLGVLVPPASAATSRELVAFHTTVRACSGERVHLSGRVLLIDNFFFSGDRVHDNFTLVPRQVIGTSATGVAYHAVGGLRDTFNVTSSGIVVTETFTTQFIVVSENGDGNTLVVEALHITVAANGEITALFDHFQARCVG